MWHRLQLSYIFICALTITVSAAPSDVDKRGVFDFLTSLVTSYYAPTFDPCPTTPLLRRSSPEQLLSPQETEYIAYRTMKSQPAWRSYLTKVALPDFDIETFLAGVAKGIDGMPNIALCSSGGGQRAMLVAAGIANGFDGRNEAAVAAGTGGLQQIINYMGGLSGGAFFTMSWALNNFGPIPNLQENVWTLQTDLATTPQGRIKFLHDILLNLEAKKLKGFAVSSVDLLGRALSAMLLGPAHKPDSGPGSKTLISTIIDLPAFAAHQMPFPIIIALGRSSGEVHVDENSPIYEFSPYEFGTWDHTIGSAFVRMKYLGTSMIDGVIQRIAVKRGDPGRGYHSNSCVKNFDNAGFLIGTSGNALGTLLQLIIKKLSIDIHSNGLSEELGRFTTEVKSHTYVTAVVPNPFRGLSPSTFRSHNAEELFLVDGGLGDENIPFSPFIQTERKVDVLLAIDSSANHDRYPNGEEAGTTYRKSRMPGYKGVPFPYFPPVDQFLAQGLNKKISFFGSACTGVVPATPLVIYFPNYKVDFDTNTETAPRVYSKQEQAGFMGNGFKIATQSGNVRAGLEWPKCLACALIDKKKSGTRSTYCQSCFAEYCYMGTDPVIPT